MRSRQDGRVQVTVRNVSVDVEKALKRRARMRGASLNQVLVEALTTTAAGVGSAGSPYHDLDDLFGTWVEDPPFDAIVQDQGQIDESLW